MRVFNYRRHKATMWQVEFTAKAEKEIKALIKDGKISELDRSLIGDWTRTIKMSGPEGLRVEKHWRDHSLEREWSGFRSSAYSPSGRIIYKVIEDRVIVIVVRITPSHDYK